MKIVLHLTTACNLRCKYCYAPNTTRKKMPQETARQGIDLALEQGTTSACVSYFGGEPLLMFDRIKELTSYAVEEGHKKGKKMHFRLSTNGLLFTEEILRFCRDYKVLFAVSLDGDREAHNAQRIMANGKGSFDELDAKIDLILEYNPIAVFTSVITPATAGRLLPSIEYMWGRGIRFMVHQLDYSHPEWTPESFEVLEQSYRELGAFYARQLRAGEHFHMSVFDDKIKSHAHSPFKLGEVCDFGARKLSVAPDGRVFPCVQFVSDRSDAANYCVGHVATGLTERRQELIQENKQERHQCDGCAFVGRCSNFCGCMNWQVTGKITEVPGILCAHERMLIPIADEIGSQLWAEKNGTFLKKHYRHYAEQFPYDFD
jgi:uncharacterized protein